MREVLAKTHYRIEPREKYNMGFLPKDQVGTSNSLVTIIDRLQKVKIIHYYTAHI